MNRVWSHADTMRGRAMIIALCVAVLLKEAAVPLVAYVTGMVVDPLWSQSRGGAAAFSERGWSLLGLKVMSLLLTYHRRLWARAAFGALYLLTAGMALYAAYPRDLVFSGLPRETLLTLLNAGAGLLIGMALLAVPQLRAYEESYAAGGVTIPIAPTALRGAGAGPLRRLGALLGTLWSLLPVLGLLAIFAYAMGWYAQLRGAIAPLLGR